MIPSTPLGVALLLVLIAPGLAYVLRREKVVPTGPRTAFREALQVIFVSVVSLATVGILATLLRVLLPNHTPDVRRLVHEPGAFARGHHVQLAWWAFGLFAAAVLLAWAMADPRIAAASKKSWICWLTGAGTGDIADVSAWWNALEVLKTPGTQNTNVGVLQGNGSYIQGTLVSSTAGNLDYDKRELILTAPLIYITAEGVKHELEVQMVVISGRDITRLDVTHLPPTTAPNQAV